MRGWSGLLITAGVLVLLAGLILRFAPGLLSWFGRLPGDLRFEGERTRVYIPITSMLLLSLGLSILLTLIGQWRGR
ncbi:MAG: DUF2905 domain-containing protein [Actinomycetota bacterium]|nr:DUF2905 domain-containing protein [Actinomycetota bacterium]